MNSASSASPFPESVLHVALTSSSIASAGYWPAEELLELRFLSGARYRYLKVPQPIHSGLMAAESKGRYFNEAIRGRFGYLRVEVLTQPSMARVPACRNQSRPSVSRGTPNAGRFS